MTSAQRRFGYGVLGLGLTTLLACGRAERKAANTCASDDCMSLAGAAGAAGAPSSAGSGGDGGGGSGPTPDCSSGGAGCGSAACEPNQFRCDGAELLRCNEEGSAETIEASCRSAEHCDARQGRCTPLSCDPGSVKCDGATVLTCASDGSEWQDTEHCALNTICRDGQCEDLVCQPSSTFCADKEVRRCSADATASSTVEVCGDAQYCFENSVGARCLTSACPSGEPICDGDFATRCNAEGSGPEAEGMDCAAAGQVCHDGECREAQCIANQRFCRDGDLYLCNGDGAEGALLDDCDANEYCDPYTHSCRVRACTPGEYGCDGMRVTQCDELGSQFIRIGVDCEKMQATCIDGQCRKPICSSGARACIGKDLYQCDDYGMAWNLSQHCADEGALCVSRDGYPRCAGLQCTPDMLGCNGNHVAMCNSDGTDFLPGETDCGWDACSDGRCQPAVCWAGWYFCNGQEVRFCEDGVKSTLAHECGASFYCFVTEEVVGCPARTCLPDGPGCRAEQFGTCDPSGAELTTITSDCHAQGQVCTFEGCADRAIETVGKTETSTVVPGGLIGNAIRVTTSRTLTKLEAYLVLPSAHELKWLLYEIDSGDQGDELRLLHSITSSGSGSDFQSSGQISWSLESGRAYFIGVRSEASYSALSSAPGNQLVSFGYANGSGTYPGSVEPLTWTADYKSLYSLRLTTAP